VLGRLHERNDPRCVGPPDTGAEERMKRNVPDPSGTEAQPLRLTLVRAALRRQEQAGIYCKPTVSLEFQRQSRVYVVRGVESGGTTAELGHYVVFCGLAGERVSWLQPLQSVASNGPHAVVIAPALVSIEVFRARQTYDLLIARHQHVQREPGTRPRLQSQVVFRGTQGFLSLELWGRDRDAAGKKSRSSSAGRVIGKRFPHHTLTPQKQPCKARRLWTAAMRSSQGRQSSMLVWWN
jgi:hypothetical protein